MIHVQCQVNASANETSNADFALLCCRHPENQMLALVGLQTTAALLEHNAQGKAADMAWVAHVTGAHSAMQDLLQQLHAQEHMSDPRHRAAAGSADTDRKQAGSLVQLTQAVLSAICAVRKAVQKTFLGNVGSAGEAQITSAVMASACFAS